MSGLDEKDEAFQVNTLIYSMEDEAEDILNVMEERDKLAYEKVIDCVFQ